MRFINTLQLVACAAGTATTIVYLRELRRTNRAINDLQRDHRRPGA